MTFPRALSRPMLRQHLIAAAVTLLAAASVYAIVAYDRADPVVYEQGRVLPDPAHAGQRVVFLWNLDWRRRCQATVLRDIVGADNVVRRYKSFTTNLPVKLGPQSVENSGALPVSLPPGQAIYRAVLIFNDCGLTARWWPLQLATPEIRFAVIASPSASQR